MKYRIQTLVLENSRCPFDLWLDGFDTTIQVKIEARIARFEDGNFGDHKSVSRGLFEARFFFGSGYRVYFSIQEDKVVLLLNGGDKSSQVKDINNAQQYLKAYLENQNANKK